MIFVTMVVIAPVLIDDSNPVFQRAADRLHVVVLCFWHINDYVSFKQRHGQGYFLNKSTVWDLNDSIRRVIAAEIDQLCPSRSATAAIPVTFMQSSDEKYPPDDSATCTQAAPASFANRISAPTTSGSVVQPSSAE